MPILGASQRSMGRFAAPAANVGGSTILPLGGGGLSAADSTALAARRINRKRTTIQTRSSAGALGGLSGVGGGPNYSNSRLGMGMGMNISSNMLATSTITKKEQPATTSKSAAQVNRFYRRSAAAAAVAVQGANSSATVATIGSGSTTKPAASSSAAQGAAAGIALTPIQSTTKKSSLVRKVGGGAKNINPLDTIKRRVKFSANVHTYPSSTSTKKSARIGEIQLKKRVKKLKRNRSRKEGGGGSGASLSTDSQHGYIYNIDSKRVAPLARGRSASTGLSSGGTTTNSSKRLTKSSTQAKAKAAISEARVSTTTTSAPNKKHQQQRIKAGGVGGRISSTRTVRSVALTEAAEAVISKKTANQSSVVGRDANKRKTSTAAPTGTKKSATYSRRSNGQTQ
ncbi:AF4/FMR2 family member lilli [Drosophila willistoni]|uniref:AF4/FMR2 family member lilli n=1 Tax=Drosophila willistoni TaxID=7260 RepID=UPI000C26D55C|nr:AF4/FMR2 family member lilli [Drosophila willistoni]